jgi:CelD/BcsL family acetyltransferase involved in cellulose biosynthesis
MRAEIVTDPALLAALEAPWWALWERSSLCPFLSPAWLIPWWDAFAPGALCTIAIHADARLVGLAPLYIETSAQGARLLPLGISLSDYFDLLADSTCEAEALAALAAALADLGVPRCDLEELPPGAKALRLPLPPSWRDEVVPQSACPVMPLPSQPEALRDAVPSSQRRSLQLARNRAARRQDFAITEVGPEGAGAFLDTLICLHAARWQARGEAGVLDESRTQAFHRAALPRLAARGLASLHLASFGGEPVAAYYGLVGRHAAYDYITGFDPAAAFVSPATLLIAHAMERAIARGATEFHFLRGREGYKYGWGAADRCNVRRSLIRGADVA